MIVPVKKKKKKNRALAGSQTNYMSAGQMEICEERDRQFLMKWIITSPDVESGETKLCSYF